MSEDGGPLRSAERRPAFAMAFILLAMVAAVLVGAGAAYASQLTIGTSYGDSYFSPNGDGQEDTWTQCFSLSGAANASVDIRDSKGALVRTIESEVPVERYYWGGYSQCFSWDGLRNDSSQASDGVYKYTIKAVSTTEGMATASGQIGVDRNLPGKITKPKPAEAIKGAPEVEFTPTPGDSHFTVSSATFYGKCEPGYYESICEIASAFTPGLTGAFSASADISSLIGGANELYASIAFTDELGGYHYYTTPNTSVTAEVPERIDQVSPVERYFSPNGDGQEDTAYVSYHLHSPGKVSVVVENQSSQIVKTLANGAVADAGYGSFTWDGTDSNTQAAPDGVYTFKVTASDPYGSPAIQTGKLGLDRALPAAITAPKAGAALSGTTTFTAAMSAGYKAYSANFYGSNCPLYGYYCGLPSPSLESPAETISGSSEVGGLASGENEVGANVYYTDPFGEFHSYSTVNVPVMVGNAVPINKSSPAIAGNARRGEYLYVSDDGSWSEQPVRFEYEWLRCNLHGAECAPISEASSSYYYLEPEDVGHTLKVRVTPVNAHGTGSPADSSPSAVVRDAFTPESTNAPSISGNAVKGDVLVADEGEWTNEPTAYDYQWLRCSSAGTECQPISHADARYYALEATDVGHRLAVQVTASNVAGSSQPAVSAAYSEVKAVALHASAGEALKGTVGVPVTLDGTGSVPADSVVSYQWSFGDGKSGTGATVNHTYIEAGIYTATLTVNDGTSESSDSVTVTVSSQPSQQVEATIEDTGGNPIEGANVLFVGPDGKKTSAVSGTGGKARLNGLPDGSDTLYAYKEGFKPAIGHVTVAAGAGNTAIQLASGAVATSTLKDKAMTLKEIEEAGIDTNDPANQNVYEFEARLAFFKEPLDLHCYINSAGEFVGGCGFSGGEGGGGGGGGGGVCSAGACEVGEGGAGDGGGSEVIVTPSMVSGHPLIQWLIIRGKVSVLKQFETVEETIQNLSGEPFKLVHGSAKLNLPEGLSLAPTAKPQSFTQQVTDVGGNESQTATWVIRGDTPGEYHLTAEYNGQLEPFEAPVELQAALTEPLKIWGKEAFSLSVAGDEGALAPGRPYHVVISVTNVAPIPFYNLNLAVDGETHANFVFQPGERYGDFIGELRAGQTLESHKYIVVPDEASQDVFNPSLSSIAFDGEERQPGSKVSELKPPTLYSIEALTDTAGKVHLHWQPVADAEGYEVFYSPNLDTAKEWTQQAASETRGGTETTQQLAKTATDVYLTGGGPGYYAVSSVTKEHLTLESTAIFAQAGTGVLPTVTKLKPTSGPVGGGTTVTITGTGLTGASAVMFGATSAISYVVKSATSITAVAPASSAGTVDLRVTTPGGTSAITTKDHYKFTPTVTGLSPSGGPATGGTNVTITGTGFGLGTKATVFKFGTTKATSINCLSSTECKVTAPGHAAGKVDVKATVNKVSSPKNLPGGQYTYS